LMFGHRRRQKVPRVVRKAGWFHLDAVVSLVETSDRAPTTWAGQGALRPAVRHFSTRSSVAAIAAGAHSALPPTEVTDTARGARDERPRPQ
jgi:hypothetical protein